MNGKSRALMLKTLNILFNNPRRETKLRDAPDHGASQSVGHLINRYRKASFAQLERSSESCGPRSNNANGLLAANSKLGLRKISPKLVHDKALQISNLYGTVTALTPTRRLTRCVTHTPTDRAERIGGGYRFKRLGILFFPDVPNIRRCISSNRTGYLARGGHKMWVCGVI